MAVDSAPVRPRLGWQSWALAARPGRGVPAAHDAHGTRANRGIWRRRAGPEPPSSRSQPAAPRPTAPGENRRRHPLPPACSRVRCRPEPADARRREGPGPSGSRAALPTQDCCPDQATEGPHLASLASSPPMTNNVVGRVHALRSPRQDPCFGPPIRSPSARLTCRRFRLISGLETTFFLGALGRGCTTPFFGWRQAAFAVRRCQKSSKRPLRMQQRRAVMASAPATVQRMPARLSRAPMTSLQPDSTTADDTQRAAARNSG